MKRDDLPPLQAQETFATRDRPSRNARPGMIRDLLPDVCIFVMATAWLLATA